MVETLSNAALRIGTGLPGPGRTAQPCFFCHQKRVAKCRWVELRGGRDVPACGSCIVKRRNARWRRASRASNAGKPAWDEVRSFWRLAEGERFPRFVWWGELHAEVLSVQVDRARIRAEVSGRVVSRVVPLSKLRPRGVLS